MGDIYGMLESTYMEYLQKSLKQKLKQNKSNHVGHHIFNGIGHVGKIIGRGDNLPSTFEIRGKYHKALKQLVKKQRTTHNSLAHLHD